VDFGERSRYIRAVISGIQLRKATRADRVALEDVQRRASLVAEEYREALIAYPDAIDVPLGQIDAGDVTVAEHGGAIVGFAAVVARAGGDADLDAIFVVPELWKQGIGRVLLDEAERIAIDRGALTMHVVANPTAIAFYQSCGYNIVGRAETRFGSADAMVKPLL
jgi:GNAT superfamily N-acetyltransferase